MRVPGQSKVQRATPYEVIESDGVLGGRYPVEYVAAFNEGYLFLYKKGITVERVYAGRKYIPLKMDGLWWIGKRRGNNSAALLVNDRVIARPPDLPADLPWFSRDEISDDGHVGVPEALSVVGCSTDPDCPGEDLSRLVGSNILSAAQKATRKPSYTWLLVIGAVIILIAFIAWRVTS